MESNLIIDDVGGISLTKSEYDVSVNGNKHKGWMLAKPLNYDRKHNSIKVRLKWAWRVFIGKAIPISFFEDLSDIEKEKYVREKMNRPKQANPT